MLIGYIRIYCGMLEVFATNLKKLPKLRLNGPIIGQILRQNLRRKNNLLGIKSWFSNIP